MPRSDDADSEGHLEPPASLALLSGSKFGVDLRQERTQLRPSLPCPFAFSEQIERLLNKIPDGQKALYVTLAR
jgi:hypothetical protein